MTSPSAPPTRRDSQKRNRGFDETHRDLIATAVRLISEKGTEGLSIASLARAVGINRATIYYHFKSRDELLEAVRQWSGEQLARGMDADAPRHDRMGHIAHFVLENPELIRLWIDDFVAGGDIRNSYPRWDELVAGVRDTFASRPGGEEVDAEVYCLNLLTSAIIGPHVMRHAVAPGTPIADIAARFIREQNRMLAVDMLADGK